ncbi:MAG: zinc ABC transporter substrate-binding protein [Deltaproteobacteria bacterium]|nr:zinc ABC transporter substrate-binding protein [Deltaproteobacteria bacterium]
MFKSYCKYLVVLFLGFFFAGLTLSCSQSKERQSKKPVVIVSVLPQSFFVREIAGDAFDVQVLLPPFANHDTYEPSIEQMKLIYSAKAYIKVGHPNLTFETIWLDRLVKDNKDIVIVDTSKGVELMDGDPHTWLSPKCVRTATSEIAGALSQLQPENAELFAANLKGFLSKIDHLDRNIKRILESKSDKKKFFVFHPAWGYFANDYGLEQVAIEHDHKEPGPNELIQVIEHARKEGAKMIFVQPQFSSASAEVLASELDAKVVIIDPMAFDWLKNLEKFSLALASAL